MCVCVCVCVCVHFKRSPAIRLSVKFPVLDSSSQISLELSHFFSSFSWPQLSLQRCCCRSPSGEIFRDY